MDGTVSARRDPARGYVAVLILAVLAAAVLLALGHGWQSCEDRGGVAARSAFGGYECVEPRR